MTVRNKSEKIIAVKGVFPFSGNMTIHQNPAEDFSSLSTVNGYQMSHAENGIIAVTIHASFK